MCWWPFDLSTTFRLVRHESRTIGFPSHGKLHMHIEAIEIPSVGAGGRLFEVCDGKLCEVCDGKLCAHLEMATKPGPERKPSSA